MELVRNYEKRILLFFLGIALILGIRFPVFADEVQYPQDAKYGEVVGKSEVELSGEREKNRAMETNNGNFITDAMYWYAEKTGMLEGLDDVMVLMNGGSIRAAIPKGEVTKRELFDVSPYGNLLMTRTELLTGCQNIFIMNH